MTSSLTLNQVTEAITEKFNSAWGSQTPFTLEGEEFTPPNAGSWVRLSIRNKGSTQETMGQPGNRIFERKGIIIGSVFTPITVGRQSADILAQTLKDIFEGTEFSGVICYTANIDPQGTDGLWYQVAVKIDFVYYETK